MTPNDRIRDRLNTALKIVLIASVLFPPFKVNTFGCGHGFIFSPPESRCRIDAVAMLCIWLGIGILAAAINSQRLKHLLSYPARRESARIDAEIEKQRILADAIIRHAEITSTVQQKNLF